jgi:zinc/manganese transport system substrate-binding protein
MKKILGLAIPLTLTLAACAGTVESTPDEEQPAVVMEQENNIEVPTILVSNSILGSVVGDILVCAVGDTEAMTVLMPLGSDPHDFQPSSEQVASMVRADLVVVNGLGLELGLEGGIAAAIADGGQVFEVAQYIDPLEWVEVDDGHDHDHGHGDDGDEHGELDPHFWFDLSRMGLAAELLGAELTRLTTENVFEECGVSVGNDIRATEAQVQDILSAVSVENRLLVTDHEALSYFAQRYDFTIIGVVIPGGSTLGAPDSRALAQLVGIIRDNSVSAIFGNTSLNPQLLEALATEVGGDVQVVELFVESLGGPGSGAESYSEMMLTNATRIAQALTD